MSKSKKTETNPFAKFITPKMIDQIAKDTLEDIAGPMLRDKMRGIVEDAIDSAFNEYVNKPAFQKKIMKETRAWVKTWITETPLQNLTENFADRLYDQLEDVFDTCEITLTPQPPKKAKKNGR